MSLIEKTLYERSFVTDKHQCLARREILPGYFLEVYPKEDKWIDGDDFHITINSLRFADFIKKAHQLEESFLDTLPKRKLIGDDTGTLATALVGKLESATDDSLTSGGVSISLADYIDAIGNINSPFDLKEFFFQSELGLFLSIVEKIWVYLFLLMDEGLNPREILEDYHMGEGNPILHNIRTKTALNMDLLLKIHKTYHSIATGSCHLS